MEFKGTKGKWEFINFELKDFYLTSVICEKEVIAQLHCKKEFQKANALLISKAPEMLEKLKYLLSMYTNTERPSTRLILETQQLIKEATEL